MEILYFDQLNSTHKYLINKLKTKQLSPPIAIVAKKQSDGIGTHGNRWESLDGNLFLSLSLKSKDLPKDLPKVSICIYFTMLMQLTLQSLGSKVWLKWPNDLYIDDKKVGGAISTIIKNNTIFSIGLNIKQAPKNFKTIDIDISIDELLQKYILKIKEDIFWKEIFIKYKIQFEKSKTFLYFDQKLQKKISLKDAILLEDGSIEINKKRIVGLR